MAGNRIKGITVEIGGDTTKLQTALKGVNTEIRNTQSQLRDVEKLLKLDPGNTELLVQKQRLLKDAVAETKQKLETLKTAAEQANQALANGDISQDQYDALQREIIETEQRLRSLEQQLDKMQEELDTLTAELTDEAVCSDYQLMQEKCQRMEELRVQMDETMEQMILLEDELG